MRNSILILIFLITSSNNLFSQEIIRMNKEGGVYTIPCEVNGLMLKFIFDTGASDVSISLSEAIFMLKNGHLSENDIEGSTYYQIANGEVMKGTTINLRELTIGHKTLNNVKASIVHTLSSPLLLGQSALSKLGKFSFDYSNNILVFGDENYGITNNQNPVSKEHNIANNETYITNMKTEGKLRSEDNPMSSVVKYIPSGATVRVIEKKGDYFKVFYDGETGYLNGMYLNITYSMSILGEMEDKNSSKSKSSINNSHYEITTMKMEGKLRNGDTPMSSVIKYIPSGATVRVLEKKGDYFKVFYDGETGYLNGMYLNITYNISLLNE